MRRKDMYTLRCPDLSKPLVFRTEADLEAWLRSNPEVKPPIWVTHYDRVWNKEITRRYR